ncbi:AraC family transcriptional regulator [Sphingomonas limnosediminicola]|uniref:AraC family transcriptional regulator n=1 Tax=Sphingomonas limnosediminicola TaxID=940133 RepID=A0ABP7LL49_9SPHN
MLLQARAVTLTNYDEVARFVGLDPSAMIRGAGLRPGDLRNPENWLPAAKVIALLDQSAEKSGRDDFGILLGKCRTFTSLGPVSLLLKHEATIGQIILAAEQYSYLLNDLLHLSVQDDGRSAIVEWNLVPGLRSRPASTLTAAIAYKAISEALEFSWDPDCMHFRDGTPENLATFKRFFRCRLEFESAFDGMSCSSVNLRTPNPFADPKLAAYARELLDLLPGNLKGQATAKTNSAILLMLDEGDVSLDRAAECLGLTARSLQRRLKAEGTSFNQLCRSARRELAMRYLANSTLSVTAVAELLGYSQLATFGSWFLEEFGLTPTQYRRNAQILARSRSSPIRTPKDGKGRQRAPPRSPEVRLVREI